MIEAPRYCHELVSKTAQEIAGTMYEELAKDDLFYTFNPNQRAFIKNYWPVYIGEARKALSLMLGQEHVAEGTKRQIHNALLYDRSIQHATGTAVH